MQLFPTTHLCWEWEGTRIIARESKCHRGVVGTTIEKQPVRSLQQRTAELRGSSNRIYSQDWDRIKEHFTPLPQWWERKRQLFKWKGARWAKNWNGVLAGWLYFPFTSFKLRTCKQREPSTFLTLLKSVIALPCNISAANIMFGLNEKSGK